MKNTNNQIKSLMNSVLLKHPTPVSFESVWSANVKKNQTLLGLKRIVAIPLIITIFIFAGGFASYSLFHKVDKTDYAFLNDDRVIGKWKTVDFVEKVESYTPDKKQWGGDLFLSSLVFIQNGKMLNATQNGNLAPTPCSWTKDKIINKQEKTASKYLIKEIGNTTYMFYEWKSGDYSFRNKTPWYYVLKKEDNNDYSNYQIRSVKEDKTDYPFIDDAQMRGKWESVDFVDKMENFKPGEQHLLEELFLKSIVLENNGKVTMRMGMNTFSKPTTSWTKGLILNKEFKTASICDIKEINGNLYMFYEWKSGDYLFRGQKPMLYVLRKKSI